MNKVLGMITVFRMIFLNKSVTGERVSSQVLKHSHMFRLGIFQYTVYIVYVKLDLILDKTVSWNEFCFSLYMIFL